jgi:hypothetical protein
LLGLKSSGNNPECIACGLAKAKKHGLSKDTYKRATRPFYRLHVDIGFGKGGQIFQLVVDDFNRKGYLQSLPSKAHSLGELQRLVRLLETKYQPYTLAVIKTDGEPIFKSHEFEAYCDRKGAEHEINGRMRHDQHGVVERRMDTLGGGARASMITANAPERLFMYAMRNQNVIVNNVPTSANSGWTPNEKDAGISLNANKYLLAGPFGCLGVANVYKEERKKHDDKGIACVKLMWDDINNVTFVEAWDSKKIFATTDVTLYPRIFPYWEDDGTAMARPKFDQYDSWHGLRVEGENVEVRRSVRGWQPTGQALRNMPDVAAAPEQQEGQAGEAPAQGDANLNCLYSIVAYGPDPKTQEELLNSPFQAEWMEADLMEMASHHEHKTWRLITREQALQEGLRIFKCKIVRKTKLHPDGTLDKRKSRFVIMAFTKMLVQGVDYEEKYAGTARWSSVLGISAYANHYGLILIKYDVVTFFLYGKLGEDERLVMEQPAGHEVPGKEDWVCDLQASIYGCPQGAYRAKMELKMQLVDVGGFKQLKSDDCVFVLKQGEDVVIMATHVDDMLCAATPGGEKKMRECLEKKFKIKVFENPSIFTGAMLERNMDARWLKVHQGHYVRGMLERLDMTDCIAYSTPMEVGLDSKKPTIGTSTQEIAILKQYQGLVGELMWLRTRPDIMFAVNFLCRFLQCAGPTQMKWAKRVLQYLKSTPDMGLVFQGGDDLQMVGAVDADFAGDVDTSKSTTGYCLRLGRVGTVAVRSGLQTCVSDSTAMAETYAGKEILRELIWHREFQKELGNEQLKPTRIRADNQAMIAQSKNTANHMASKHYRIAQAFNREHVENGLAWFDYTESKLNEADMFTKALARDAFERHRTEVMGAQQDNPRGSTAPQ